ncbi:hypothetical protein BLA29_013747, partial [Euroglyphus maynei]
MVINDAFAYCHSITLFGPYYKDYIHKTNKSTNPNEMNPSNFYKEIELNMEFYESLLKGFDNIDYSTMKQ